MPPSASEVSQVLRDVAQVFRALQIVHALGGSMAGVLDGVSQPDRQADLLAEPFPGREEDFVSRFGPAYYVNVEAVRASMRRRSGFTISNQQVGFAVNVSLQGERPFDREALRRRVERPLSSAPHDAIFVLTPEDVILHALDEFRISGETSQRHWADVLGVLRSRAGQLDATYLEHWANELSLNELLQRAREQT